VKNSGRYTIGGRACGVDLQNSSFSKLFGTIYDGTMHFNAMTMAHTLQRPVVLMRSYNSIDSKVAGVDV
jgi:hypothetical protein